VKYKKLDTILKWFINLVMLYVLNSLIVMPYTKYDMIEGIISDVKCIRPTSSWHQGSVKIFYNQNKDSIEYSTPYLYIDNFDKGCQTVKKQIKIGDNLKVKIYENFVNTVDDVYINNKKIRDAKDEIKATYIVILIAILIIAIVKLSKYKLAKKNIDIHKTKFFQYVYIILAITAILRFVMNMI